MESFKMFTHNNDDERRHQDCNSSTSTYPTDTCQNSDNSWVTIIYINILQITIGIVSISIGIRPLSISIPKQKNKQKQKTPKQPAICKTLHRTLKIEHH